MWKIRSRVAGCGRMWYNIMNKYTLDVYGHVTDDMKRDAADKVSGVLKGAV